MISWPSDTERMAIIGRTGSGKTVAGLFNLSRRSWDAMPWIIFDFKGDPLIRGVERAGAKAIDLDKPPKSSGLYIVRPHPDDLPAVDKFLSRVWENGKTGLYFDEGYMVGDPRRALPSFRALLTQGRSKRIPIITLSQRPSWLDRFVWTESEYFQVYHLQSKTDWKSAEDFMPVDLSAVFNGPNRMPDYYSLHHAIKTSTTSRLSPVPEPAMLLSKFRARLRPVQKFL